ncbi:MAG: AzlC family ABC transporter permease [Acidimicrobiales bacterium]|nr:AzlC family ABC transporter permease [Acidimicrobiales bacterium]
MSHRPGDRVPAEVRDALAIGLAVGVFGVAFGVLAVANGLSALQACAMSALVFTGASQFAAVGVIGAGGSVPAALGSALLLAARNGVYGLSVARFLPPGRFRRLGSAQLVIDESTALAVAQPDEPTARRAFFAGGLSVFVCWNLGTAVGALGGGLLGDPATLGLDAAFPAGFVALLLPLLRDPGRRAAAIAGAVIAAVCLPFTSPGVPILMAALGVLPVLALERRGRPSA